MNARGSGAHTNILDHHRPGGGPIAFPQLNSIHSIIAAKEKRSIDGGSLRWCGTTDGDDDLRTNRTDADSACCGAVGFPETRAAAIVRGEEQGLANVSQHFWIRTARASVDILYQHGA